MSDIEPEDVSTSSHSKSTDKKERGSLGQDDRRQRSRSPRRDRDRQDDRPRRRDAGFKWKDRRWDRDGDRDDRRDRDTGLQRGYKDHYRPRSKSRSRSPPPRRRSPRRHDGDRPEKRTSDDRDLKDPADRKAKSEKKEKKAVPPPAPTQPMIIVYVNDRLGTKKAIPCYPTDPISELYYPTPKSSY